MSTAQGAVVVQQPEGAAEHLFLLFHGVGSDAPNLAPLGRTLAQAFPRAAVISVAAPHVSDFGSGRQWFSVSGVTEANRLARVEAAMPAFAATVREWQARFGVGPQATTLVGFSQGSIMALESARLGQALAGRIVAFAGRFSVLPQQAPPDTTLHLIHGEADPVIPAAQTRIAAERLRVLGADVTADFFPSAAHEITPDMQRSMIDRLTRRVL
ncbi:esterase [Caenimonas aquaedulcis]|uniref:Esterase n=1 Tax=Caenimonas aquaedulcis TaxID=2793270 RepID=A0A931H702_9BURK|nr:esterase [Caenimonas aquaedulcis]